VVLGFKVLGGERFERVGFGRWETRGFNEVRWDWVRKRKAIEFKLDVRGKGAALVGGGGERLGSCVVHGRVRYVAVV